MPPRRNRNTRRRETVNALANCVLPQRIVESILCRLPVKSLVRFKRVCKPWSTLFTTPTFINTHYNYISEFPKTVKSDKLQRSKLGFNPTKNLSDADPTKVGDTFLASCRGLICFARPLATNRILLWNPATRLSKILPDSKEYFGGVEMACLGFGCNEDGDDFKVVRIFFLKRRTTKVIVEAYSSKSNSWRTIGDWYQFRVHSIAQTTVVKGSPYWVVHLEGEENNVGMLRFDTAEMSMKGMRLPPLAKEWTWVNWGDRLAGLECVNMKDQRAVDWIDVWLFDHDDSMWRRNVRVGRIGLEVDRCVDCNWKDGVIIVECINGDVFAFDAKNGSVRKLEVKGKDRNCYFGVFCHEESLAYVEEMEDLGLTEDNQITENCVMDGFFSYITRRGTTDIEVYYALSF